MNRIAIIGAGISGLTSAQLLKDRAEVIVYEKESQAGGLIRCERINGSLFHTCGGHVFNTKIQQVLDWFWQLFDKDTEFHKTDRNSVIFLPNGQQIPYPIENFAYLLEESVQKAFINDIIKIASDGYLQVENFQDFLQHRFGDTLYKLYFEPYNRKVWRRSLIDVPIDWLAGKLPMPTVEDIIFNNIFHVKEQSFVHSSFYYPKKGGSQFIADTLSAGLNIRYGMKIDRIEKRNQKYHIGDEYFDRVVFCGNIKQLPSLLAGAVDISGFTTDIENLEYHGTTSVFCEIEKNPYSWIYMPNKAHESHRIICTGNFSPSNNAEGKMTGTIEFTDYISEEDIKNNLFRIPMSPKYITHHYEKYTYPIQDKNTRQMINTLKTFLNDNQVYLCGRFAEWEYANMDVCIGSAINLYKIFNRG